MLFALGFGVGVFAHEAGHFALASWLRLSPRSVGVGVGPVLFRTRWGKAWIVVRLLPVLGHVVTLPQPAERRAASGLFMLGGVSGNVALFALLGAVTAFWPAAQAPLGPVAAAQVFLVAANLAPLPLKVDGVPRGTDGLHFPRLLFRPEPDALAVVHRAMLGLLVSQDAVPRPSAHTPEIVYQWLRRDRLTEAWASRDASDVMRGVLESGGLPAAEKAFVLDFLVSNELLFGGLRVGPACLEAWSSQLLALVPTPAVRVMHGGVLVALGRAEEAKARLLEAAEGPMDWNDKILCHAFLAQASGALGDAAAMRHWMGRAYTALPGSPAPLWTAILKRLETTALAALLRGCADPAISAGP